MAPGERKKSSRKKKDPDAPKDLYLLICFSLMKTEILLELKTQVSLLVKLVNY